MKFLFNMMSAFFVLFFLITHSCFSQTILFLGDSLTEGYRLPKEKSYPSLVEIELKKTFSNIKVINGGVSGATTASGLQRLNWYLKAKLDVMVLALGANDGLRGFDLSATQKNLERIIEKAQKEKVKVILAGMKMPTNMGNTYRKKFESIFPKLAEKYSLPLIPFLLDQVGGVPKLNLSDGIHPNAKGHQIMAQTVLKYLKKEISHD